MTQVRVAASVVLGGVLAAAVAAVVVVVVDAVDVLGELPESHGTLTCGEDQSSL